MTKFKKLKTKNLGLLPDWRSKEETKTDYLFGEEKVAAEVLQPDGQWMNYLPTPEYQKKYNLDVLACVSFSCLNCIETLYKRKFNEERNFSDRFLAKISGTTDHGNSLWKVADTLRHKGEVDEQDWAWWTPEIDTWEEYYASIPAEIVLKALLFLNNFEINYEWVDVNDKEKIKTALKYAPLQATVGLNAVDENGYYFCSTKPFYNHAVCLFGYKENDYWLIFDHYEQVVKRVKWDYQFGNLLKYNLNKKTNFMMRLIKKASENTIYLTNEKTKTKIPIYSAEDYAALTGSATPDWSFVETLDNAVVDSYNTMTKKLFVFNR